MNSDLADPQLVSDRQFVRPLWHHGVLLPVDGVPIEVSHAEGVYVFSSTGERYIDAFGSSGAMILGHARLELAEAAYEQMRRGAFFPAVFGFSNAPARQLAKRLLSIAGHPDGAVWFATSGSEAIETAMKIALNYHLNRGEPERRIVLTCRNAYHGNTLGAATASGLPEQEHFTRDAASGFERLPPTPHASPRGSDDFIATLQETIDRIGAERVAAFIGEPIPTPGGIRIPVRDHWRRVQELLTDNGILMVADEVLNGFGRTGKILAQHNYDYRADVITLAKGLTSGHIPLSACVVSEAVAEAFDGTGPRALRHLGTYSGHPTSCAVGLRTLELIETEGVVDNATSQGMRLREGLARLAADYPSLIGLPIGIGLLLAVPVHSPEDGERAPERSPVHVGAQARSLQLKCRQNGLLVATPGDAVGFWPPLVVSSAQVDEILEIFEDSVMSLVSMGP